LISELESSLDSSKLGLSVLLLLFLSALFLDKRLLSISGW
jgi:hypothetical protein